MTNVLQGLLNASNTGAPHDAARNGGHFCQQVPTAFSIFDAQLSELAALSTEITKESEAEAAEDISLVLGGLSKRREDTRTQRTRILLIDLAEQAAHAKVPELKALFEQGAKLMQSNDFMTGLLQAGLTSAQIAAVLAHWISRQRGHANIRKWRKALNDLIAENNTLSLEIFAMLESVPTTGPELATMRRIYEDQSDKEESLAALFEKFRQLRKRDEVIRAMIRSIGMELILDPYSDQAARLVALLDDLKRLLLLLGFGHACETIATAVRESDPTVSLTADEVLGELLNTLDQPWLYPEWTSDLLDRLGVWARRSRQVFASQTHAVIKALPAQCFQADDQLEQVLVNLTDALEALDEPD